jgi:hypothetical protein
MEWFTRKTSIVGIQISNWMIVLGAVDLPLNFHPAAIRASAVDTSFGSV